MSFVLTYLMFCFRARIPPDSELIDIGHFITSKSVPLISWDFEIFSQK